MAAVSIGFTLHKAREQRGLSLEDIANRTHISSRVLEAIEHNALDRVPGGLFTRGYLRAYAGEVGLDGAIGGSGSRARGHSLFDVIAQSLSSQIVQSLHLHSQTDL
jgi:transcriptional regulator with XRE-family HTH domain